MGLEERLATVEAELEKVSAELLGFKLAFIRLSAFLPLTERDVTAVRELAIAQAEESMALVDTPTEATKTVFSTIHGTMALAGDVWRQCKSAEPESSSG